MPKLSLDALTDLAARGLKKAGASRSMARSTAQALVAAEMEGLATHGVSRVALYAQHLREGRADGKAKAKIIRRKGGACLIDACGGLAYEAVAIAAKEAIKRAGVMASHSVASPTVITLARQPITLRRSRKRGW